MLARYPSVCSFLALMFVVPGAASAQSESPPCEAPAVAANGNAAPSIVQREILVADRVRFKPGKTRVSKKYNRMLDALADALVENEKYTAALMGHADAAEPSADLRSLSHDRATAVRKALVKRGIAADRLQIVAYGDTKPADSDPANNRRVEFKLIEIVKFTEAVPFDAADATPTTLATIDDVADQLVAHRAIHLRIEGHTDCAERRTEQGHASLGLTRAAHVRRALIARGVAPTRLSIASGVRVGPRVSFHIELN